jgi:hypothetical protein
MPVFQFEKEEPPPPLSVKQWFPNGVSRHPGVSGGTTKVCREIKKSI